MCLRIAPETCQDHPVAETKAVGVRAAYEAVPEQVRSWVERELGSAVVSAESQSGGFSPGAAARLVAADGSRAFVKAVGPELNPESPGIHRSELAAMRAMPETPWTPRLLAGYDDGDWVALLFEDIEGRQPHHPWPADEVERVFGALGELSRALTPTPWAEAPKLTEMAASFFHGWGSLAESGLDGVDPWIVKHLPELVELQERAVEAVQGDTLTHWDIRADNVLLTPAGGVVFVDWAWACQAAGWADAVAASLDLMLSGTTVDVDELLATQPATVSVDQEDVTALIAAVAGALTDRSRAPAPPGLPTIRDYQRRSAEILLEWTKRRTGW
jgi:hypothetical protein